MRLKLAHSPDSDDAFMFYGLATKKIPTGHLHFDHVLEDIETLNQKALDGVYDITAVSFHGYAYIADSYSLLPCGASFGERYGPIVVARGPLGSDGLRGKRVAVPGRMTTAFLVLQLYEPHIEPLFTPFDQIFERIFEGEVDAGVVIHEGQLTYAEHGLSKVADLGEWWHQETALPLPLGGNAIRRSLGHETIQQTARLLKESIQYGLDHREEALAYAIQFSRGLDSANADRFVSLYVNDRTLDYGEEGRAAVQALLDRGYAKGLLPHPTRAEFVE
ncbi:MAG TPA: MqnA/MqnD/SBP family protein [Terriglobia bacterium]|nr:MqnA/MqnD/SBP family protein [Terriglobia bacterium]